LASSSQTPCQLQTVCLHVIAIAEKWLFNQVVISAYEFQFKKH